MLTFHTDSSQTQATVDLTAALPAQVVWIDALNPDAQETAFLERVLGTAVPRHEQLVEIETSSRLARRGGYLYLSTPAVTRDAAGRVSRTVLGFVLSCDRLLTVRFAELRALDMLDKRGDGHPDAPHGGIGAFLEILEAIIDHVADMLEHVGSELERMSRRIFGADAETNRPSRPRKDNMRLRDSLQAVGRCGDLNDKISETVLGLGRIAAFVESNLQGLPQPAKDRLASAQQDIASLVEYETHLSDKAQFLLDTTLGLANIDQNNVFRVLTVVSVIGIPPTFIASMYGMNFKNIPEYDWAYGYEWGLGLILVSALLPAAWFKWRGWW